MKFSAGTISLVVIAGATSLAAALPIGSAGNLSARDYDDDAELFARWGKGRYKIDDTIYHDNVKKAFLTAFQKQYSSEFTSKCGTNPDFDIDRNGMVTPRAVAGKAKGKGLCTKAFSMDLGELVIAAQPKRSPSPSPPPSPREYLEEFDDLD